VVTAGSNLTKIHKPIGAGERHFGSQNQKRPGYLAVPSSVGRRPAHGQVANEKNNAVISIAYKRHRIDSGMTAIADRPPQIWPHLPALLVRSSLRFAAIAI
jgi:hypothetical protein